MLKKAMIALILLAACNLKFYSQETIIIMDTTDYLPYPDGRHINLAIAASKGYPQEIKRLINQGAQVNFVDYIGATPMIYAVANKKKDAVITLLEYSPNLDIITNEGETALHIATKSDFIEIAEILIRAGAQINIVDNYKCAPLHYAAIYGLDYMTDLLIYYEADINAVSKDGTTPLMAACWAGHAIVADMLIKAGADVNMADDKGFTALHLAAQNADTLISRLLLDNGADIAAKNNENLDIASIAARTGSKDYSNFVLSGTGWLEYRNPESVDPALIARKNAKKDTYLLFKKYSRKKVGPVLVDNAQVALSSKFNIHDIYLGGRVSFIESLYSVKANIGFGFKPGYTRVLSEESDNVYYQYFDKRYLAFMGLGKEFPISDNYFRGTTGLILNLNFGYMVANKYRGTNITPPDRFLIMPSFGLEKNIGPIGISLLYEYMNTGLYKAGPHWMKIEVSYNLDFFNTSPSLKNIKWY